MMRQLSLFLSIILIISCENSENASFESIKSGITFESYDDAEASQDINEETAQNSQVTTEKIIKTANLRFETQDLEKTRQQVSTAIKNAQGYIQSDNSGKEYNQIFQRITVRVPTKKFQQALEEIAQGVAYFDERTISQQNVTAEFIDLNARLKTKRALEDRYLSLLSKAKNVKEMLEIERELSQIREEIEAKEGRLKYLSNQVSLSTIYIHFYKITTDQGVTQSYSSKMSNALKNGWNGISVFFLGLLHFWPFLILLGISTFFIRRWIKKKRK